MHTDKYLLYSEIDNSMHSDSHRWFSSASFATYDSLEDDMVREIPGMKHSMTPNIFLHKILSLVTSWVLFRCRNIVSL